MKAPLVLALALVSGTALLCACGAARPPTREQARPTATSSAPASAPPPALPARPVLRVGTSGDYAPFSKDGRGLDIELTERMANDLGYRVEWVRFSWPELHAAIREGAFDLAVGGITWRADRSVVGFMSRALAVGGPCVLSRGAPSRVAVNRGGILERWARSNFAAEQLRTVDDNLALPDLLERGEVDAIVTDSFELPHFARPGLQARCEPPTDRKVYWVGPGRAAQLGPAIDAWLTAHEAEVAALRARFLGQPAAWTPVQHLIDLLGRRLALMPAVAAYKREHTLPIDDPAREVVVLGKTVGDAAAAGLDPDSVRALFAELIALAKTVQQRGSGAAPMDLDGVLRPALDELGRRILAALAACAPELPALQPEQLELLSPLLEPEERARLLEALRAVRRQDGGRARLACPPARCARHALVVCSRVHQQGGLRCPYRATN
jgi:cyclohexadienyl dehydratase